jgi:WD40 repeat protein
MGHKTDVFLIAVDNVSENQGRLAVSHDKSQTAIIWDIQTGDTISQIASHEEIRAAAWMRNSLIAFGE